MSAHGPEIWTVSQLTRRVKSLLEDSIGEVWVAGEISNWKVAASGHAYFTLKDKDSQLDAVIFKGSLRRLKFTPGSGLEVLAHGRVTVYERRGNYQIVLDDMQPKGIGALQQAFEQLKRKLEAEGLFAPANKKTLPMLPRRIGIVTSPAGAAVRDILNVLERRFANVHVLLYPARVQGGEAAAEIAAAIRALDRYGVDVMIVGRGGGSLEDLWPFNEEAVVRAVFEAKTPIISAVGHEVDFTLADFAADVRAPTPSAAAELVVQEREALLERLALLKKRMRRAAGQRLERSRYRLDAARGSFAFTRPDELFRQRRQAADELRMRLEHANADGLKRARADLDRAKRALALLAPASKLRRAQDRCQAFRQRLVQSGATAVERCRARFVPAAAQLDALSPLAILSRGYALVFQQPGQKLVREATQLAPQDEVRLRFGRGAAAATITRVEERVNDES